MRKGILFILMLNLIFACSIEPSKIEYGKDACSFCKMNIVEKAHAAQIVTKKGKPYKYDAIECMLNDLDDRKVNKIALFLVTDYLKPTLLIDAKSATYLVSSSIKSPMGANLSAFSSKKDAEKFVKVEVDKLFNWQEIKTSWFSK